MKRMALAVTVSALMLTGRATAQLQALSPVPPETHVRELRLGVVCYGGVSLAIYMYGTTREIHSLLLASDALGLDAHADPPVQPGGIGEHGAALSPSARYYYRLLSDKWAKDKVRTRVVVDIISGTSAGGINGIVLAKAIATNRPIDNLRKLWFEEADIVRLAGGQPWALKAAWRLLWKRPVLTGDGWLRQLYEAFAGMDQRLPSSTSTSLMPLDQRSDHSRLDLLVTSTNYYGSSRVVEVGDPATSNDKNYTQVFHFQYPNPNGNTITFAGPAANATLAFAARSSASFPVAFPPMSIENLLKVIPEPHLDGAVLARQVFRHQLADSGNCGNTGEPKKDCAESFAKGLFLVDGGVLDNYPLGIAFQQAGLKTQSVPAQRIFLYLEPDPSPPPAPGSAAQIRQAPNSWQIIWGASATIPGNEPIAEDFRQLARHNERVDRILDLLDRNEQQAVLERKGLPPGPGEVTVATLVENAIPYKLDEVGRRLATTPEVPQDRKAVADQRRRIEEEAAASQPLMEEAYTRLRVHSVLDQLARNLAFRVCGLPDDYDGPRVSLARAIVFRWAEASGLKKSSSPNLPPPTLDSERGDRQRRKDFLAAWDLGYLRRNLRFVLAWIDSQYPGGKPTYSYGLSVEQLERAHTSVTNAIDQVSDLVRGNNLAALLGEGTALERLSGALCKVDSNLDRQIGEQAAEIVDNNVTVIDDFMRELAPKLLEEQNRIRGDLFREFVNQTAAWNNPEAQRAVLARYLGFPYWDRVAYPYTAFSGTGELTHASVVRLSPRDADSLSKSGAERLSGSRVGHFGAFFNPNGRESDYVWGRLDGAERLSKVVLGTGSVPDGLFGAILDEERGVVKADVLARLRRCVEAKNKDLDECKTPPSQKTQKRSHQAVPSLTVPSSRAPK